MNSSSLAIKPERSTGKFSKNLRPIRALFPSWKFFDRLGEIPILEFQVGTTTDVEETLDAGSVFWRPLEPAQPRTLSDLLFNPIGNRNFALHTLIGQWVDELQEIPEHSPQLIQDAISFQLLCNWIRNELTRTPLLSSPSQTKFRFRLLAVGLDQSRELFFQSEWLPAVESL